jgi:hypothetical protein
MKRSNINSIHNCTITTYYSSINNKCFKNKICFNIESSEELKMILDNENIFKLNIILNFIINASRQFPNNLILFYEIILSIMQKIKSNKSTLIKLNENDKEYIKIFIKENKIISESINKKFDDLFSQSNLEFYLYSKKSHSIIVILYMIMVSFTYYTFEIEKKDHPKRQIIKLLKRTRNKYICFDNEKIKCNICSLNHIQIILNYLKTLEIEIENKQKNFFINTLKKSIKCNNSNIINICNINDNLKQIEDNIFDIQKNFNTLDNLIEEQKKFLIQINKNLLLLSFKDYEK